MLKCVIWHKETTEKRQCPVNWKRYNSGAGYLYTFERDLTLNYEAGKVNLAIIWNCFYVVNRNASTLASRLLQCGIDCRGAFNSIILDRMMKRKMTLESKYVSVRTESKGT